ncbi:MAG: anthranilate phosphoribosyltransferase [Firmicutes bacterium]|nr:anthranilate phosphoribosyltransferase [Bacillota bacterium]
MKEILKQLARKEELGQPEINEVITGLAENRFSQVQIAGFLMALLMKGPTVGEIAAIARSMQQVCIPLRPRVNGKLTDTCGTGGGLTTFNVSSANALLSAAAGVKIAKHGSRSISASSGSADVLEALGIEVELEPRQAELLIEETGFSFLYAPLFHPVMLKVFSPENELGIKTIFFTIIGPLINPAGAKRHVLGVYQPQLVDMMAEVVAMLGFEHVMVLHGTDGLDELSLLGETKIAEIKNGKIRTFSVFPEDFGLRRCSLQDIKGGSPVYNANIIRNIFSGKDKGPRRDMLLLNAAATMVVGGKAEDLFAGFELARHTLDSGLAMAKVEEISRRSKELKEGKAFEPGTVIN